MDEPQQDSQEPPLQADPAGGAQPSQARQKTELEAALDGLIMKRQEILDALKLKNAEVAESRRKISSTIPAIRGKGSGRTMGLIREAEHIEFEIATSAYTPKKEKELIKRLREIKTELSKHKELDDARKQIEAARSSLSSTLSEIKVLEGQLADARKKCDEAYAAVLSERREAFESRKRSRDSARSRQFEELQERARGEKKKRYDDEIGKYMKDYDDTVSMEEIVVIEKKARQKEEGAAEEGQEEEKEE